MTKDLSDNKDWAHFLPAISGFWTSQMARWKKRDDLDDRLPDTFELGFDGLDNLRKDSYFYYPYGLYSAGHATLDLSKVDEHEAIIQKRDRENSIILGDSGGFQLATGVLKLDWANALDPEDPARLELCEKILKWLEYTSDWAMTLDVPAFAALPPNNEKTGLTNVNDTLTMSMLNLDYFMKNRTPGKTKFLNVMSGADDATSQAWFDQAINFSDPDFVEKAYGDRNRTLEGYAFAAVNGGQMAIGLKRILQLRDKNLLHDKDWIHYLGIGRLDWACYLTSIQRCLRKWDNPNITLSFDAASPYVNVAFGQCYTHNNFSYRSFGYGTDKAIDNKDLKGSDMPMPFGGPIMDRLTVGDICRLGRGDLNMRGQESNSSWDSVSYGLYMAHSVYKHADAVQEANRLADIEHADKLVDWREWVPPGKKASAVNERSRYVPGMILMFDSFVRDLLDPNNPNPYQMLEDNAKFLETMNNNGWNAANGSLYHAHRASGLFTETEAAIDVEQVGREEQMSNPIMEVDFEVD